MDNSALSNDPNIQKKTPKQEIYFQLLEEYQKFTSWSNRVPEVKIRGMAIDMKKMIGLQVRTSRNRQNLTQEQLAEAIDRTVETVSNIERGQTAPSLITLDRLSRTLGIPLRDFFEDSGQVNTHRRAELEVKIRELARSLTDEDLEIAVGQVEVLEMGRKSLRKR